MSEKKELNKEQLEKVAGGGQFYRPCDIEWFFSKNATVYVKLDDNTPVEGKSNRKRLGRRLWSC